MVAYRIIYNVARWLEPEAVLRWMWARKVAGTPSHCFIPSLFEKPVHFEVERDTARQEVLRARMLEGSLPRCEIISNVEGFSAAGSGARGVCAGFPCQGISSATEVWRIFDSLGSNGSDAQFRLVFIFCGQFHVYGASGFFWSLRMSWHCSARRRRRAPS